MRGPQRQWQRLRLRLRQTPQPQAVCLHSPRDRTQAATWPQPPQETRGRAAGGQVREGVMQAHTHKVFSSDPHPAVCLYNAVTPASHHASSRH
jgi:hypothetical protein